MFVKYSHVRRSNSSHSGGYTIAYTSEKDSPTAEYAIARCNPKDNFNKALGRTIASGRLESNRGVRTVNVASTRYRDVIAAIIADVDENNLHTYQTC